jgi:hypothetical protein
VARLLGYRWPQQHPDDRDQMDDYADATASSACRPSPAKNPPTNGCARCWPPPTPTFGRRLRGAQLLEKAGFAGQTCTDWLRDGFFQQHCKLFKNRPFIWHIWDGAKTASRPWSTTTSWTTPGWTSSSTPTWATGFAAKGGPDAGLAGADGRLVAALELKEKLEAIR